MRELRKNLFKLAVIVNTISMICGVIVLAAFWFDIDGFRVALTESYYNIQLSNYISKTEFFVLLNIYFAIVVVVSFWASYKYSKQTKLTYPMFLLEKHKTKKVAITNTVFSFMFIVAPFIFAALSLAPSNGEMFEYNIYFTEKQRESYFRNLVVKDPILSTMTMQINLLKQKLEKNEINQEDYNRMLNEILDYGVSCKAK